MITAANPAEHFQTFHEFLEYDRAGCLFFDIETTGLSPASSSVFLIGAIRPAKGRWQMIQWMAETPAEEKAVISAFLEEAEKYSVLIHFNGSSFDLPFLVSRAKRYGLSSHLQEKASVDLYRIFRPVKQLFALSKTNQSSLETLTGWQRQDRLTGRQMTSLYRKYAASGEPLLSELLLLHNRDDLTGMTQILSLASILQLLKGSLTSVSAEPLPLEDIEESTCLWQLSLTFDTPLPCPLDVSAALGREEQEHAEAFRLSARDCSATLSIPCHHGEMMYFFPDYKNYYYLPLENQAIHKSVAVYVDKKYRVPAKPNNCFTRKKGVFLPQPEELIPPAFRRSYQSDTRYFLYTEELALDSRQLLAYASSVLRSFFPGRGGTGWSKTM